MQHIRQHAHEGSTLYNLIFVFVCKYVFTIKTKKFVCAKTHKCVRSVGFQWAPEPVH